MVESLERLRYVAEACRFEFGFSRPATRRLSLSTRAFQIREDKAAKERSGIGSAFPQDIVGLSLLQPLRPLSYGNPLPFLKSFGVKHRRRSEMFFTQYICIMLGKMIYMNLFVVPHLHM